MRRTDATLAVADVLLANPSAVHYGWDTSRVAGRRSATVYRVLDRFMQAGWLEDGWEDPAAVKGRPPRRYYRLTDIGRTRLAILADG